MTHLFAALAGFFASVLAKHEREAADAAERAHPSWCEGCRMRVYWGELHSDCERRGEVEGDHGP